MSKIKSIILLSGGLDSLTILGAFKKEYNIQLALTFDYGQKSALGEINAAKKISEFYKIEHKIITLDWLKEITNTSLVSNKDIPTEDLGTKESAKSVWVPNRNGLFLNIAACYADAQGFTHILFGANKDEGKTFPDNTEDFRAKISEVFEYSTLVKPQVSAPLIKYTKNDIVRLALDKGVPLELVKSCYDSGEKHCGICESCRHLKKALEENNAQDYLKILFNK